MVLQTNLMKQAGQQDLIELWFPGVHCERLAVATTPWSNPKLAAVNIRRTLRTASVNVIKIKIRGSMIESLLGI